MVIIFFQFQGYTCAGVEGKDVGKFMTKAIARHSDLDIEVTFFCVTIKPITKL